MRLVEQEARPTLSIWERFPKLTKIPADRFPKHVLIIPDGNGRWAEKFKSLSISIFGHENGYEALRDIMRDLRPLPIDIITIWGFSADNWTRPKSEIDNLMSLFERATNENLPELLQNNIRFVHLGRKDRIPPSLRETIEKAEKATELNTGQKLCFAIDFGGNDQAVRIGKQIAKLKISEDEITPDFMKKLRDGNGLIPPADLTIRTSGELRTSDLGWLAENTEFYSIPNLLPDTKTEHFVAAIVDFSQRERRFGGRINLINR